RARIGAHLADPAELSVQKGRKQRAKTDRVDARQLRELLCQRRLPGAWIPPPNGLGGRAGVALYKNPLAEATRWWGRVRAPLFHQGVPYFSLTTAEGRERLEAAELSPLRPPSGRGRSASGGAPGFRDGSSAGPAGAALASPEGLPGVA